MFDPVRPILTNRLQYSTITVSASPPATTVNVSVVCNPSSVLTNGTSACSATVAAPAAMATAYMDHHPWDSINAFRKLHRPGSTGTATVKHVRPSPAYQHLWNDTGGGEFRSSRRQYRRYVGERGKFFDPCVGIVDLMGNVSAASSVPRLQATFCGKASHAREPSRRTPASHGQ